MTAQTALFALATSLLWGLADFGGGLLTRRTPALTVVVVSQSIAAAVLGAIVVATGGWSAAGPQLWFAFAAGLVGPVALLSFYKALALGPMGVVSPLGSLAVAVPITVGLFLGERPGLTQVAGIVVAVVGVVLMRRAPVERRPRAAAGGPPHSDRRARLRHGVRADRGGVLVGDRAVPRAVRAAPDQRRHRWRGAPRLRAARRRRPSRGWFPWRSLPALAFVGLADVAANGTYSVAAQHGPVTVAAVLASLYPVVTALAARGFLSERLRGIQAAGAGLALVGTVLLATG